MDRAYPSRINWENEPSLNTPINNVNLNKIDAAVYTIDGRVVGFDTTKANQSDLLSTIKTVAYNTTTGVFTFTYWNGQTFTVDLNIEAIPVSFSMSPQGVITMKTTDGSTYTADVSSLIKTTTLQSSAQISWTATTDSSGNKTWTGTIVLGSITENMLQPNFLADCRTEKTAAQQAADISEAERLKSEGWARGTQDGEPVGPISPYYHDNAKYWKEQAAAIGSQSFAGLTDVEFTNLQNGEIPVYNSTTHKWENGQAASPIEVIDALDSTSTEDALSANQGRVLKEGLDDLNTDLTSLQDTVTVMQETKVHKYTVRDDNIFSTDMLTCITRLRNAHPEMFSAGNVINCFSSVGAGHTFFVGSPNANYFSVLAISYYGARITGFYYSNGAWTQMSLIN